MDSREALEPSLEDRQPSGRRERSRARVVDAARLLFAEHGFDGVSMQMVAREAGLSRATVFNHFSTKSALLEGVTERVLERYGDLLRRSVRDSQTPIPDRIRQLFREMSDGISLQSKLHRLVFREIVCVGMIPAAPGRAYAIRIRAVETLEHLLTQGQAQGALRTDVSADDLASALDSVLFGTVTRWLMEPSRPLRSRMDVAVELFLEMASSPRSHRAPT